MTAPSKKPARVREYNKQYQAELHRKKEQEMKQSHREVFLDTEDGGQGEVL